MFHQDVGVSKFSFSFPVGGTGHCPNPLLEAPQASLIALLLEVGP